MNKWCQEEIFTLFFLIWQIHNWPESGTLSKSAEGCYVYKHSYFRKILCGKVLWINLWRMWKSSGFPQQYPGFLLPHPEKILPDCGKPCFPFVNRLCYVKQRPPVIPGAFLLKKFVSCRKEFPFSGSCRGWPKFFCENATNILWVSFPAGWKYW